MSKKRFRRPCIFANSAALRSHKYTRRIGTPLATACMLSHSPYQDSGDGSLYPCLPQMEASLSGDKVNHRTVLRPTAQTGSTDTCDTVLAALKEELTRDKVGDARTSNLRVWCAPRTGVSGRGATPTFVTTSRPVGRLLCTSLKIGLRRNHNC